MRREILGSPFGQLLARLPPELVRLDDVKVLRFADLLRPQRNGVDVRPGIVHCQLAKQRRQRLINEIADRREVPALREFEVFRHELRRSADLRAKSPAGKCSVAHVILLPSEGTPLTQSECNGRAATTLLDLEVPTDEGNPALDLALGERPSKRPAQSC
ncbi:hypothetical protein D9M72_597520 [compost metagenome]